MAPEVLLRKLAYMRRLLADLEPYRGATLAQVEADHYKIERLFELLVVTATDILFHELAEMGRSAESYRSAFGIAAEVGRLPEDLAKRLQAAAGTRNILVHLYEDIDYAILHSAIEPALSDFHQFVTTMSEDVA